MREARFAEMDLVIDQPGQHVTATDIDNALRQICRKPRADLRYPIPVDKNISLHDSIFVDDRAVDEQYFTQGLPRDCAK
jgi:hypothetical protein